MDNTHTAESLQVYSTEMRTEIINCFDYSIANCKKISLIFLKKFFMNVDVFVIAFTKNLIAKITYVKLLS